VNGFEKLTGEASNSVDRLDLNINARALGCIGVDTEYFVPPFCALMLQASKFSLLTIWLSKFYDSSDFESVVIE